jgi:hypothetical protein
MGSVGNPRFLLHNDINAGPGIEALKNLKSIDRGSIRYLFGFKLLHCQEKTLVSEIRPDIRWIWLSES